MFFAQSFKKKKRKKGKKRQQQQQKKTPLKKRSEVELGLQLRHFLYSPTFESPEKACQQAVGKITTVYYEHCRTTPHFELSHADVYVLVPWSLSPQLHSLCLLQVWRKRARSGRSIQARQSEWSMTVQYRRELEERISTLQSGWAQRSKRAESAPKVDAGEQGARRQQDGCL